MSQEVFIVRFLRNVICQYLGSRHFFPLREETEGAMKWEGIIIERKEKKEIEDRVQDIREKVEMPSFLQRPWVKSKNKTVATDACSQ